MCVCVCVCVCVCALRNVYRQPRSLRIETGNCFLHGSSCICSSMRVRNVFKFLIFLSHLSALQSNKLQKIYVDCLTQVICLKLNNPSKSSKRLDIFLFPFKNLLGTKHCVCFRGRVNKIQTIACHTDKAVCLQLIYMLYKFGGSTVYNI